MYTNLIRLFISIPMLCLVSFSTSAQGTADSDASWKFLIEPYLMFPYMNGTAGVGELPDVSVDADAGDIFSHLQIGAMLSGEAYTKDWVIGTDIIYMILKQDVNTGPIIEDGALRAKQFAWEISGLRRLLPWLDAGIGGRINSMRVGGNLTLNTLNGTENRNRTNAEAWFDPIIIARIKNMPDEKLLYQLRGDIGGFGIGADLTWQIQAYVGYRFSHLFQMSAGYRIISIDYENEGEDDRFKYDIDTSGPVIRFGFNL